MINSVVLVGRLTKDPEKKTIGDGVSCCHFTIAVKRNFGNESDFINCTAFRTTADNMVKFLHKGSLVGVEGRIQVRSFDGQNGRVYMTEVVADSVQFLEPSSNRTPAEPTTINGDPFSGASKTIDIMDDDLPF